MAFTIVLVQVKRSSHIPFSDRLVSFVRDLIQTAQQKLRPILPESNGTS